MPALVGGGFNVKPQQVHSTDFLARAGMSAVAPSEPTSRTAKSNNVIGHYIMTTCLAEQIQACRTLSDFPQRPHSPVQLVREVHSTDKVLVLEIPTKLPLQRPFGPAQEALRWKKLENLICGGS